jgi:hypothetical protein
MDDASEHNASEPDGATLAAIWPRALPIDLRDAVEADVGGNGFSHVTDLDDGAVLLFAATDLVLWRAPGEVVRVPYRDAEMSGMRFARRTAKLVLGAGIEMQVPVEVVGRVERHAKRLPATSTVVPKAPPVVVPSHRLTSTDAPRAAPSAAARPPATGRPASIRTCADRSDAQPACAVTVLAPRGYARVATGELVPVTAEAAGAVVPIDTPLVLHGRWPTYSATVKEPSP